MTNAIIGTAGHVDYGKTSLIKALTGIDTDRLKEEKKRGITIELGFAHLTMPSGEKVGIVDVPGHEKFIKNMLAGAGSVDVALLVIAADEGIMPQTREHLDILSMLKINCGVIALNKADMVEAEWLEMVSMEIEEEVKGSFLENAKIIPVSATTGEGVGELRQHIFELLEHSPDKGTDTSFRLPIDRVFTMEGFGTVVTGTLVEGYLNEGDEITIFPSLKTTKARHIQVFGEQAVSAKPGQRVAINLAQIKYEDVVRGDVLAPKGSIENSYTLDVRLDILDCTNREIQNNTRVHLYHGTRDLLCRISLIGKNILKSGEFGYAQLRLAEPLTAKCGDPFVIRFYSPLETVGGGVILDPCANKARNNQDSLDRLTTKEKGSLSEKIEVFVKERPFADISYIKERFFNNCRDFDKELTGLVKNKILLEAGHNIFHYGFIARRGKKIQNLLLLYHEKNPLHKGMPISELRSQIFDEEEQIYASNVIDLCHDLGYINKFDDKVAHKNFSVKVNERQQKIYDEVLKSFHEGGFSPPAVEEMEAVYAKEKKVFKQVLDNMISGGALILLTPQILIHSESYEQAKAIFVMEVEKNGEITLAQFRDKLETSRKYAMALLEYFDRKKISKKVGDSRVLG